MDVYCLATMIDSCLANEIDYLMHVQKMPRNSMHAIELLRRYQHVICALCKQLHFWFEKVQLWKQYPFSPKQCYKNWRISMRSLKQKK